jgi:hypothetical protein
MHTPHSNGITGVIQELWACHALNSHRISQQPLDQLLHDDTKHAVTRWEKWIESIFPTIETEAIASPPMEDIRVTLDLFTKTCSLRKQQKTKKPHPASFETTANYPGFALLYFSQLQLVHATTESDHVIGRHISSPLAPMTSLSMLAMIQWRADLSFFVHATLTNVTIHQLHVHKEISLTNEVTRAALSQMLPENHLQNECTLSNVGQAIYDSSISFTTTAERGCHPAILSEISMMHYNTNPLNVSLIEPTSTESAWDSDSFMLNVYSSKPPVNHTHDCITPLDNQHKPLNKRTHVLWETGTPIP